MRSCSHTPPCPCDAVVVTDYDASVLDTDDFVSTGYAAVIPPLGQSNWQRLSCMQFASSPVSQGTADFLAQRQAILCSLGSVSPYGPENGPGGGGGGGGGPSPNVFFSAPASCSVTCPDGSPFVFTVPAGAFVASSQAAADAAASSFACQEAVVRAICLGNISPSSAPFLGVSFLGTIVATGGSLGSNPTWAITAGSLPTGLSFNPSGTSATITGTATVSGTYAFTVSCTDPLGDTMSKTYTMFVSDATGTPVDGPGFNGAYPNGRGNPVGVANGVLNCAILSDSPVWNSQTPSDPYVQSFAATNVPNTSIISYQTLRFTCSQDVTVNWRYRGNGSVPTSLDPVNYYTQISTNWNPCTDVKPGNPQNPPVADGDGSWSITGSFTITAGTPVYVRYGFTAYTFGPANAVFEWYITP